MDQLDCGTNLHQLSSHRLYQIFQPLEELKKLVISSVNLLNVNEKRSKTHWDNQLCLSMKLYSTWEH